MSKLRLKLGRTGSTILAKAQLIDTSTYEGRANLATIEDKCGRWCATITEKIYELAHLLLLT